MQFQSSPLILEEYFIIKSNFNFIEPANDKINIKKIMSDYEIDIDFIVRDIKGVENKYVIFSKININNMKKSLPGYSIFTECVSFFSFSDSSKLNEKEKSDLLWGSGVSISINNLRNYIASMTAFGAFGKYSFPSVDLTSMLKTKQEILNKRSNTII